MTKNQIWLGLGAAALVAGVAYYVTVHGQCSGVECQIVIKIDKPADCAAGNLYVYPDPAKIKSAKHIKWTIDTPDYAFTANGIQITGSDFSADHGSGQGPDTNKWRIRDKHLELGKFKYNIAIKPASGEACKTYDPFIVNE